MNGWSDCERIFGPLVTARRAGAASAAEEEQLERHLAGCVRCRALQADLDHLTRVLNAGAQERPLDHPEPEALAAHATGKEGLPPGDRERIEVHLAACPSCRAEREAALAWSPPALVREERERERIRRPWRWFGAGAASAAAVCAGFLLWPRAGPPLDGPGLRTASAPVQIRGSHHRAAGAPSVVRVPPSGDLFAALTVEASPGSALTVELVEADGTVASSQRLVLSDPQGLVFVAVPVALLRSDRGGFRVRVEATGETFDYPFQVERD